MVTMSEFRSMPIMKAASDNAPNRFPDPTLLFTAYSPT
jgi:hypothetical protein